MLANIYLHWLDKTFSMKDGPAQFANAELIRYVDDCVILVRYVESQVTDWIEATVEDWFGLTINREKTKVFDLSEDGTRPGFLGYSLRYDKDRHGRNTRYLNLFVREASCKRRRGKISDLLGYHTSFVPIPKLIFYLRFFYGKPIQLRLAIYS